MTYFALYALQHRGQESAGIGVSNDQELLTIRERGLVAQVFNEQKLAALPGQLALGHVRYGTSGTGAWENSQPLWRDDHRPLIFAHNGNLTNARALAAELDAAGIRLRGNSDSEIIAALISAQPAESTAAAVQAVIGRISGAYSAALISGGQLVAFRDPWGIRPLALGRLGSDWVVASESCAFDIIGAEYLGDVAPGEIITIDADGLQRYPGRVQQQRAHCLLEEIYLSRPDSLINGRRVQKVRGHLGARLWDQAPVDADLVVAVPDSGIPAADGLARAAGLPRVEGLIKNRYVGRTFIKPSQELRQQGLKIKFNPLPEAVAGQRLIVVDDSIVRGNTTREIVAMLRQAGATEIHLRISSPPVRHGCHYGVDLSGPEEMIANQRQPEEIATILGADSLAYLPLSSMWPALGAPANDYCAACFTGRYPLGNEPLLS